MSGERGSEQRTMNLPPGACACWVLVCGLLTRCPLKRRLAHVEQDLILVGLVGMIDPPRPEVREAVRLCKAAGIRPVMITGDHPLTARHIAQALGISDDDRFVMGQELENMPTEVLRQVAADVSVFARVSPEHKIRLVEAYQDQGNVVAMTGDGVNDAPALKKADIGVAMGITGTDVAKEAAEHGAARRQLRHHRRCRARGAGRLRQHSAIHQVPARPAMRLRSPSCCSGLYWGCRCRCRRLQILWMNLVTDGLPALALGVEPAEADVMAGRLKPPRRASSDAAWFRSWWSSASSMSLISLGVGVVAFRDGDPNWQTLLFTTLVFSQMALALGVRSESRALWTVGLRLEPAMLGAVLLTIVLQLAVVYVPVLQTIFGTTALPVSDLLIALGAAVAVLLLVELWKWGNRRRYARSNDEVP